MKYKVVDENGVSAPLWATGAEEHAPQNFEFEDGYFEPDMTAHLVAQGRVMVEKKGKFVLADHAPRLVKKAKDK
jgi:hypothetical protein